MFSFLAGLLGTAAFGTILADALGLFGDGDDASEAPDDAAAGHDTQGDIADPDEGESPLTVAAGALAELPPIEGTDGKDVIAGTDDADRIEAGDGDDWVNGYAGDDDIDGGEGHDRLWGDTGNDTLDGGAGDDVLAGGEGDDLLLGGEGDNLLQGGPGDDTLPGGAGKDTLEGGEGRDLLLGGDGDDQLAGGWGDDTLIGGAGADVLFGGAGDDVLHGNGEDGQDDLIRDYLNGGAGDDTLHPGGDDWAMGGEGADLFMLPPNPAGPAPTIGDFNPEEDSLVLRYDPAVGPAPQVAVAPDPADAANVIVFADGHAVALVLQGAGLTPDMVVLQPLAAVPEAA